MNRCFYLLEMNNQQRLNEHKKEHAQVCYTSTEQYLSFQNLEILK